MREYKSDLFFGARTGNGRILVVDDDSGVRVVIRRMLEKAGYEVVKRTMGKRQSE